MNYQERFWRELDQLRVHAYYADFYYEKTVAIDRAINMLLAIASSGSIAGWAVWKDHQMVWAVIIAGSQVINAIKGYLPYTKRMKALSSLASDLESLFLSMEGHWFNVSEGRLNEEEIHKLHMKLKEQRRLIVQKNLGSLELPHNQALMNKAVENGKTYFNNFYPLEA